MVHCDKATKILSTRIQSSVIIIKGWMHNHLLSNVGPFFSPDLSQFFHVGLVLVNKHCPVFFSLVCSSFSRNNLCQNLSFPCGIFWRSFVERETKETFCFTEQ